MVCVADDGARLCTCQAIGDQLSTIGERLREERELLGLSQPAFAEVGGVQKRAQINYEKDERYPDAAYLAAVAAAGVDVLYVLTGQHAGSAAVQSYAATIDGDRLGRVFELLEASAAKAGKRWPAKRLVVVAAEVYNVLVDEEVLDEPKIERILKLVVNH